MSKDELLNKYIQERFMPYSTLQDDKYFKSCISKTLSFKMYVLKTSIKQFAKVLLKRK